MASEHLDELELVALAYEAVADTSLMPDVLRGVVRLTGADTGIWVGTNGAEKSISDLFQYGLGEGAMHDYARLAWASPLVPGIAAAGPLQAIIAHKLLPGRELERSEVYQQWLRPQAMSQGLIGTLAPMHQDTAVLTLMRSRQAPPDAFENTGAVQRFQRVLPYLGRAAALKERLARIAPGLHPAPTALNAISLPVFCLDAEAKLLWMNAAGERLLGQADGLDYTRRDGFNAIDIATTRALLNLLNAAARGVGGALRLKRGPAREPFSAIAIPYRDSAGPVRGFSHAQAPRVLLFVNDPSRSMLSSLPSTLQVHIQRLQSLYGLTRTEARIALEISTGQTLPAIAKSLDLAPATVRTHTKRIFTKMRIHGQVALVRNLFQLGMIET